MKFNVFCFKNFKRKSFLFMLNTQNEKVIRGLLNDNEMLNFKLNQAAQMLFDFKEQQQQKTTSAVMIVTQRPGKNLNNLQAVNIIISNLAGLSNRSVAELNSKICNLNSSKKVKTFNEIVAIEMLEQFDWIKLAVQTIKYGSNEQNAEFTNPTDSLEKLDQLVRNIKAFKNTKFSRLYQPSGLGDANLLLNVCIKCKGEIKIV